MRSAGTWIDRSGWGRPGPTRWCARTRSNARHYDAFRFFTPQARPRNSMQPDLASRVDLEQPGCLHASMDIYKWAYKLIPAVPSDLLLDAFSLARAIRELDMRASPYDLSDLGYSPVRIETAAGKAEYVAAQREFAASAQVLRDRLLVVLDELVGLGRAGGTGESPATKSSGAIEHREPVWRRLPDRLEPAGLSDPHLVPGNNVPETTHHRP